MLLLIDNYDSFTFNLAQYFKELGIEVLVKRNDEITITEIEKLNPSFLVISPGPSTPQNAGITLAAIAHFKNKLPILGVCLGHQAIAEVFGGRVMHAHKVMHGKVTNITHFGNCQLFKNIPKQYAVTRYHSLVVDLTTLPSCFNITATSIAKNGVATEIMALAHKSLPLYGVQFHPESIKTEHGHQLLKNFLALIPETRVCPSHHGVNQAIAKA